MNKKFIDDAINEEYEGLKDLHKQLNENAELYYKEYKTSSIIKSFLKKQQIDYEEMVGTGVAAVLNPDSRCTALRADMDALPVNGISHACGHDYHMTILLGTALILKKLKINKCIKFIFQPAEEAEGGALPMINKGVLLNPEVERVIGFHVWPGLPCGSISLASGPSMASIDDFYITFRGIAGHAAIPQCCNNPLGPAVEFIKNVEKDLVKNEDLQRIVSVSSLHCGSLPNIISETAELSGTYRTFDPAIRKDTEKLLIKEAKNAAEKYDCKYDIEFDHQYPPLINDYNLSKKMEKSAKSSLGEANVLPLIKTYASDDFSYFAEKVPSVHFRLGIASGSKGQSPLHSPYFDADDRCIFYGIKTIINFIADE